MVFARPKHFADHLWSGAAVWALEGNILPIREGLLFVVEWRYFQEEIKNKKRPRITYISSSLATGVVGGQDERNKIVTGQAMPRLTLASVDSTKIQQKRSNANRSSTHVIVQVE